jgi:hypothetical protein
VAPEAGLKLRAEDADDLAVISACVQDALVSVTDLTYDRAERRFTLVANRFRWEARPEPGGGAPPFERTLCAVSFGDVERASYRGFRRRADGRILALLAIRAGSASAGGEAGTVDLEFAGDAAVRLTVSAIRVHATDIGEPWPTAWRPEHGADETR